MTPDRRLERDLPELLAQLAPATRPDYRDDIVRETATLRQRPAWTFPERWLPVDLTLAPARGPARPMAVLLVLALAGLLIVAAIGAFIGAQQRRLPAPFGPAGNGLIPYVSGGDVYVGDPVTGATRLLVGGPEADAGPGFSPDGTMLAFFRDVGVGTGTGHRPVDIYVARSDGTDLRKITPTPVGNFVWISWTPDGRSIAVIHDEQAMNQLDLYDTTGSGTIKRLQAAAGADSIDFRPPDGREILFRALVNGKYGLFAMDADGTNVRTLVEPTNDASLDVDLSGAVYSADGRRIFFQRWFPDSVQLWVMNADGSDAHELVPAPGAGWDGVATVSPDGRWIAYWHHPNDNPPQRVSVVRADGTGPVIQTGPVLATTAHWIWSPDSTKILMYPNDGSSASPYLLDPEGGPWTTVPWRSDADLDWQRVAP